MISYIYLCEEKAVVTWKYTVQCIIVWIPHKLYWFRYFSESVTISHFLIISSSEPTGYLSIKSCGFRQWCTIVYKITILYMYLYISLMILCFLFHLPAFSKKNTLQWKKAQRKCQIILPEVVRRTSTKTCRWHK